MSHRCSEYCICPVHSTPLLYAPYVDKHACQDITCEHAHGIVGDEAKVLKREIYAVLSNRFEARSDPGKLLEISRIIARESVSPGSSDGDAQ